MASHLLYCDSFAHYATGDITRKWTEAGSGAVILSGGGRAGGSAINVLSYGVVLTLAGPTLPLENFGYTSLALGAAWQADSTDGPVMAYQGVMGCPGLSLWSAADGSLMVKVGASGALAASTPGVVTPDTWYYVEFVFWLKRKILYDGAEMGKPYTHSYWNFEVYVTPAGGPRALVLTDYDETYGAPATVYGDFTLTIPDGLPSQIKLTAPGGGFNAKFGDLYCTGSVDLIHPAGDASVSYDLPETFGDVTVGVIRPRADTAQNGWTPSAGGGHYAMVNEAGPDYGDTILTDGGVGTEDLHLMDPVPAGAVIYGIQALICAEKTDTGLATVAPVYREGATDRAGTPQYPSSIDHSGGNQSWLYLREPLRKSVASGADWTEAELNAMHFGPRRTG